MVLNQLRFIRTSNWTIAPLTAISGLCVPASLKIWPRLRGFGWPFQAAGAPVATNTEPDGRKVRNELFWMSARKFCQAN